MAVATLLRDQVTQKTAIQMPIVFYHMKIGTCKSQ